MYRIHIQYDDKTQQEKILEAFDTLNKVDSTKPHLVDDAWDNFRQLVEGVSLFGRLSIFDLSGNPIVSKVNAFEFFRNINDDWAPNDIASELLASIDLTQLTFSGPYKG